MKRFLYIFSVIVFSFFYSSQGNTSGVSRTHEQALTFKEKIKQRAEKFYGKALKEPKIREAPDLSNFHTDFSQDGDGYDLSYSAIKSENLITPRDIMFVLKQMKKINLSKEEIDTTPTQSVVALTTYSDKNLTISLLGRGAFSEQVYLVTIKNPHILVKPHSNISFVIKQLKMIDSQNSPASARKPARNDKTTPNNKTPTQELQNLQRVKEFMEQFYLKNKPNKDFPELCFTEENFFYFDSKGEKKFLAVLSVADGIEMMQLAITYLKNPQRQEWLLAMENLGKAAGTFHYELASEKTKQHIHNGLNTLDQFKTMVHGDLHMGNIFYDVSKGQVTFIDVESIANSIYDPISIKRDIARLYLFTIRHFIPLLSSIEMNRLNQGFIHFAKGYGKAFQGQEEIMETLIINYFKNLSNESQNYWNELKKNPQTIKSSIKTTLHFFEEPRFFTRQIFKDTQIKNNLIKNQVETNIFADLEIVMAESPPSSPKIVLNSSSKNTYYSD